MTAAYGDGQYRVEMFERAPGEQSRTKRAEVTSISSIEATRTINGLSTCKLELPVPDVASDQRLLSRLQVIRFEIDAWRDDDLIWSGPITRLDFGRSNVLLDATDFAWWLTRRFIRERVAFEDEVGADGIADVAAIAGVVATSALAVEDPILLRFLTLRLGGRFAQARYEQSDYHLAAEAWDDLTGQGLDYTALGRLLIAAGGSIAAPPLPPLNDTDFLGEVRVVQDGNEACTRAVVVGGGNVGDAGGQDPYYGLVERRFDAPTTVTNVDVLNRMAADQVTARNPPPLLVQIPSDGALSPTCKARPDQLVPGAVATVTVSYVLRPVSQQMRLTQVSFSKRGADAEQVTTQFQPVGPLADTVT